MEQKFPKLPESWRSYSERKSLALSFSERDKSSLIQEASLLLSLYIYIYICFCPDAFETERSSFSSATLVPSVYPLSLQVYIIHFDTPIRASSCTLATTSGIIIIRNVILPRVEKFTIYKRRWDWSLLIRRWKCKKKYC